jgi:methionyl-tRNA formyltransferase
MKTLLIGGTDLTLTLAESMKAASMPPAGVVSVGDEFRISYANDAVRNMRHADLPGWCEKSSIPHIGTTDSKAIAEFAQGLQADFCLVAGWYHMVPKSLRQRFERGCAGVHGSLLPELRGGAPLNWAILTGLERTGVTMFALEDGVDDGLIYGQRTVDIDPRETIGDLVRKIEGVTVALVLEILPLLAAGRAETRPQVGTASYGLQRTPLDARIDWTQSAIEIDRLVRAVSRPYSGATTRLDGEILTIWSAHPFDDIVVNGAAGQIARIAEAGEPLVVTGGGLLAIDEATDSMGEDALPMLLKANNKRFDTHA